MVFARHMTRMAAVCWVCEGLVMSAVDQPHEVVVADWFRRVGDERVAAMVPAFEAALAALWQRSSLTLGEVTLTAIGERVLQVAAESYPVLATTEVGPGGVRCRVDTQDSAVVAAAFKFILVEFLTVLGNLTAQILTPSLHEVLVSMDPENDLS